VQDKELAKRLKDEILAAYLADNVKARVLQPSGEYVRVAAVNSSSGPSFSAQNYLMALAMGTAGKAPTANKPHEGKNHEAKAHDTKVHEPTVVVMAEAAKG
jgi:polyphosphate kinase